MSQSKMTAQEIINILKSTDGDVLSFAYGDIVDLIPGDFVFSSKIQEAADKKEELNQIWKKTGYKWNTPEAEAYHAVPSDYQIRESEWLEATGIGEIEEVDSYGGEDCGSTWYSVKYFPKHDVYIRVDGWYQSHYGTEFEGWDSACKEVKPTTKTVTVYE